MLAGDTAGPGRAPPEQVGHLVHGGSVDRELPQRLGRRLEIGRDRLQDLRHGRGVAGAGSPSTDRDRSAAMRVTSRTPCPLRPSAVSVASVSRAATAADASREGRGRSPRPPGRAPRPRWSPRWPRRARPVRTTASRACGLDSMVGHRAQGRPRNRSPRAAPDRTSPRPASGCPATNDRRGHSRARPPGDRRRLHAGHVGVEPRGLALPAVRAAGRRRTGRRHRDDRDVGPFAAVPGLTGPQFAGHGRAAPRSRSASSTLMSRRRSASAGDVPMRPVPTTRALVREATFWSWNYLGDLSIGRCRPAARSRRAGRRGGSPGAAGRRRCGPSSRTTRGSAPGSSISVAQISGTSWNPSLRAASAENSAVRSGVAVESR